MGLFDIFKKKDNTDNRMYIEDNIREGIVSYDDAIKRYILNFVKTYCGYYTNRMENKDVIKHAIAEAYLINHEVENCKKYGLKLSSSREDRIETYECIYSKEMLVSQSSTAINGFAVLGVEALIYIKDLENEFGGGYNYTKLMKRTFDTWLIGNLDKKSYEYIDVFGNKSKIVTTRSSFGNYIKLVEGLTETLKNKKPVCNENGFALDVNGNLLEKDLYADCWDQITIDYNAIKSIKNNKYEGIEEKYISGEMDGDIFNKYIVDELMNGADLYFNNKNIGYKSEYGDKASLLIDEIERARKFEKGSYSTDEFKQEFLPLIPEDKRQMISDYIDIGVYLWGLFPDQCKAFDTDGHITLPDGREF